ncbi:unnamed protein product, partial [Mesorhabditis belari]|uniref:Rho-GAP domain-containing protein n=1 Tax=Mesorhabditis belari TaxID=2138241 RepID=A0AAF3F6K8_9BILA
MEEEGRWLYPQTPNLHQRSLPLVGSSSPPFLAQSLPFSTTPLNSTSFSSPPVSCSTQLLSSSLDAQQSKPRSRGFSASLERASLGRDPREVQTGSQDTEPHQLAVPRVVDSCTSYVIQHGLHTVGLFRVAGSAKRCRMLRAVLESPAPMIPQNSQLTAHDVATVLKEYLRDLPQSLLPKEHYQAYMATARLSGEERLCCCRLLVALLPTPNADTLLVLLRCLHLVVDHCNDTVDEDGMIEPGNRMDARNLATVFAPCILRANHDKLHNCLAESELQIGIVETMIRHVEEIFTIPRELQNKMLTRMRDTEPDRLDRILGAMARANYETDSALPSPFPPMLEEESLKTQKSRKQSVGLRRSDSWPNSMVDEIGVGQQESSSQQPSTSSYTDEKEERPEGRTSGRRHTRRDTHAIIVDSISAVALRANAARRRLRNVFRAFRLTSRSTPNVSTQG